MAVQHYFGSVAIAERLGIAERTVGRWIRTRGLPAYRRRIPNHLGLCWYTNDALLNAWELTICRQQREQALVPRVRRTNVSQRTQAAVARSVGENGEDH